MGYIVPGDSDQNLNTVNALYLRYTLDCSLRSKRFRAFRSKERGTRVNDSAKNGASKRAGRGWGRKEGKELGPW